MTSATERFRALLDERGVEWRPIAWNPKKETFYHTSEGVGFCADGYVDGVKIYTDAIITPEQAVAATLGRGTCEVEESWRGESEMVEYRCTACDEYIAVEVVKPDGAQRPNYCTNCGRKVVA